MSTLVHEKSAIGLRLKRFGLSLADSPPVLRDDRQLIFLCGANQAPGLPSVRRSKLRAFIHSVSKSSTVLFAENIFKELKKFGAQKNILDIEHQISEIADKVVVILESPSTYCELGAFAHFNLRQKLIVINDIQFQKADSFINLGPLAALEEVKAPVLWYPMSPDGVSALDGIGAVFPAISAAIAHKGLRGSRVQYSSLADLAMTKICLYFVHDLVLLAGPTTHEEIVEVLKFLFGDKSYDPLKNLLGVLRESDLVRTEEIEPKRWVYRSTDQEFFLKYAFDVMSLASAFRAYHLKTHPDRFK